MKKILSILALFVTGASFGQTTTTINFDTLSSWTAGSGGLTSYQSDHTFAEGLFSATNTNGLQNGNSITDGVAGAIGDYSWRLRNVPTSTWTANIASGGVSTFSVMVRHWDNTPGVVASLDYSVDAGVTWVNVDTIDVAALNNASNFVNFPGVINSSVANIQVRIQNISGERLMIDDFVWTNNLSSSCNIATSGLASLTCDDATTGSDPLDDFLTFDLNPTGTLLGTTYTVSVASGTITPTTGTYGAATSFQLQAGSAGAGNVVVTITDDGTSGCTTTETITDPGACSSATPVITLSPSVLTNFDFVAGTPSVEQTFNASGLGLTADITLTAPINYMISLTPGVGYNTTLTLPQTAGVVSATPIYVIGTSPMGGFFIGDIVGTSTGAVNDSVNVSGFVSDYVYSTIDLISTVDPNGIAVSNGDLVELTGVVHCIDFDGNSGYSITLIDGSMEGINLFSFTDVNNYTAPLEGDSLRVFGTIGQYNGLLQVEADSIELLAQGVAVMTPTVVTTLDETTESQVIKMNNLTFVTPIATFPTGSNNIDVTDGTNTFTIRIDSDTDIPGATAPQGSFSVTGVGGQFDNSTPYTEGYQLFPCSLASFEEACTTPSNAATVTAPSTGMATATGTGISYQWVNCGNFAPVSGATSQSYTATVSGNYAVIVMNGTCSDTSACLALTASTQSLNENTLSEAINVYPNPVSDVLTIENESNATLSFVVLDINGKVITTTNTVANSTTISTSNWNNGVYFIRFTSATATAVVKIVK